MTSVNLLHSFMCSTRVFRYPQNAQPVWPTNRLGQRNQKAKLVAALDTAASFAFLER
jgi:hypothetical protein